LISLPLFSESFFPPGNIPDINPTEKGTLYFDSEFKPINNYFTMFATHALKP